LPCRYSIDKERRLVTNVAWDRLTFAEMRALQEELKSDPNFDPSYNQLVDVTAVTNLDLTIAEAQAIARRGLYSPTSRRAVVAPGPAIFGMARMMDAYHAMATGREQVSVFYDADAAMKWLGLKSVPGAKPADAGSAGVKPVERANASDSDKTA
jgi:hypothetical protein